VNKPYLSPPTAEWTDVLPPPRTFLGPQLHQAEGMVAVQLGVGLDEAITRLGIYAAATDQWLIDVARSVVDRRLQLSSPTTVDAAGNVVMWDLAPGLGVPREVRRHMSALMTTWGLDDDQGDSAIYVISELVDNIIDHDGELLGVALSHEGNGVKVSVLDGSMDPPVVQPHNPLAGRGRGLQIMEALALSWGYRVHDFGKTVWARI